MRYAAGIAALLAVLTSCGEDVIFRGEEDFPGTGWAYADSVAFAFSVDDTTARYDLVLSVDHTTEFAAQNFYVSLATHLPDGSVLQQPLSLQLANKYGDWLGDCSGSACVAEISIQEGTRFTEAGNHELVVSQYSRQDPLPEITGLGFRIVRR